jgi:murein DD-endopeptidase MepM/ murein hydrolase activator NlpD
MRMGQPFGPHFSASLAMVFFLGGTSALAVLPATPLAHQLRLNKVADAERAKEAGKPALATASLGPSDGMLLQALALDTTDLSVAQNLPLTQTLAVRQGDTLIRLLVDAGATATEAHAAVLAMKPLYNPRQIRAGQEIEVTLAPPASDETLDPNSLSNGRLLAMRVQADAARLVEVKRDESGNYVAELFEKPLTELPFRAAGTIDSSLFLAADDAGIPEEVTVDLIRIFSYDVDFQREIHKGDSFEILFTQMIDEHGRAVDMGKILSASLVTSGKTHALYRFASPVDGSIDYYDERGQSAKKFLMKTPVDGARLSSGYGMRFHPILGYSKMHKGVDFAAPRGTPVMAAGQGTIDYASRYGTYGNFVRIRHGNGYKTAYAHLNSFARGIKKGAHVRQGQIIGYVGTTGRSTGPHLHYEIMIANRQVNPMSIRVPTGRKLAGSELASFTASRSAIETEMAQATVLSSTATADIAQPSNASVKR